MLTMGMDFNYQAAHSWYMNLDKLIKSVREADPKVNIFYSTPACYLNSLHKAEVFWPSKQDDFLPYASDPHAYWSGYFTSRPTSKFMIRQSERLHKIFSQLSLLQVHKSHNFDSYIKSYNLYVFYGKNNNFRLEIGNLEKI